MKQVLIAGMIVMSLIACNDSANSGNNTSDSAYNSPAATDTTQTMQPEGTDTTTGKSDVKAGAGQGTGSAAQPSQDTGKGR